MAANNISVQFNLDRELTPHAEPSERILEIAVQAPAIAMDLQRSPLNLALILDRSGSMQGEKLEFVKQAARHVVELLEEKDRVALVDYDDSVRVLFPSQRLDARSRAGLLRMIDTIRSGGSTNLSGGWLTGCRQVAESSQNGSINRALLLTDGLANVGIIEPSELAGHARELAQRGVFTSTFGVGTGFNHHLLEDMANQADGRFYFIETPSSISGIFENEFQELLTIFAHQAEVILSYPASLQVSVLGEWRHEQKEPGKLHIHVGSLPSGRERQIYVKVNIPGGAIDTVLPLQVNVLARGENDLLMEAQADRSIRLAGREEVDGAPVNEELLTRFAQVELADRASAALKLEREGKREQASALVKKSLGAHRERLAPGVAQYYENMSDRMRTGMDELDRKRSHADAYMHKQRRGVTQSFPLLPQAKGHLIFSANGQMILLDTGSPVSFGSTQKFEFMDQRHQVARDYMGVTTEYISQTIGIPIQLLLGMDVLKGLFFQIDVQNGMLHFSQDFIAAGPVRIPLETMLDVPYASIGVNGLPRKMFIDTGAKIHYLRKEVLAGQKALDTEKDFYPLVGEFETTVYQLKFELGGEVCSMRCGALPQLLDMSISLAGMDGILGTELYDNYRVTFDPRRQMMSLESYRLGKWS